MWAWSVALAVLAREDTLEPIAHPRGPIATVALALALAHVLLATTRCPLARRRATGLTDGLNLGGVLGNVFLVDLSEQHLPLHVVAL